MHLYILNDDGEVTIIFHPRGADNYQRNVSYMDDNGVKEMVAFAHTDYLNGRSRRNGAGAIEVDAPGYIKGYTSDFSRVYDYEPRQVKSLEEAFAVSISTHVCATVQ